MNTDQRKTVMRTNYLVGPVVIGQGILN